MNTLRKCPRCGHHTISLMDVAQLMLGVESVSCRACDVRVVLSAKAMKSRSLFWLIELVMYSALLYFSFYYKSWSVFAWGLCVTMSVEIVMLYLKPLATSGTDSNDFIEKEL